MINPELQIGDRKWMYEEDFDKMKKKKKIKESYTITKGHFVKTFI